MSGHILVQVTLEHSMSTSPEHGNKQRLYFYGIRTNAEIELLTKIISTPICVVSYLVTIWARVTCLYKQTLIDQFARELWLQNKTARFCNMRSVAVDGDMSVTSHSDEGATVSSFKTWHFGNMKTEGDPSAP